MNFRKIAFFLFSLICISEASHAQVPSCSAASKFYSKDSIVVTTFGASTVHGIGSTFQAPLQADFEHCYTGKVVDITNNGIPGETTTQGLARFPGAIAGRTGFMLILMGVNDAFDLANKKARISTTEKNMRYYVQESLKNNLIPIIGTLQFINDKNNDFNKTVNLYIKQINALYKKIAADNHLYVADINKALGRDFTLFNPDGLHPNPEGNNLIAFVWFDAINKAIEDKLLLIGLNQNYPNPVKDNTKIGFSLSQAGRVQIKLYNMNGAIVKDVYDDYQSSGYHELTTSMADLVPGIYIYMMQVGGQRISKKMIVTR
ncbi:SGNH/GDSL hydrolase family protein [Mucilaginibacter agri]|uniref:T9SS type A sorting domain-containing protein n=1 Tax=Mucilaginibacter agri TaxID=2695265 RepID=A0A965ZFC5_9SPHI|nr:SGNH/GDSL hydrolase family protein [Mucilaginibacter agri]NCD69885.1 T9SS type A sorting domain-containing protein [Mucilaginibacter agri]